MKNEPASEGIRERKKRETYQKISLVALTLFLKHGYEETTLEAIASGAGMSRRSLFHYFSSKEDIVFSSQEKFLTEVIEDMRNQPADRPWTALIESAMVRAVIEAATPENIAIDNLVRTTPYLQPRNQLKYIKMEEAITGVLIERSQEGDGSRRRAYLLAAIFVAAFRISTKEPVNNTAKESTDIRQRITFQFQHLWKALRDFGNEGLIHQQYGDYPSTQPAPKLSPTGGNSNDRDS